MYIAPWIGPTIWATCGNACAVLKGDSHEHENDQSDSDHVCHDLVALERRPEPR